MTEHPPIGWIFLRADSVPDDWRDRAQPAVFVPLLPEELSRILDGRPATQTLEPRDRHIATLFAQGRTAATIAGELHLSTRTVERRLAVLCDQLAVSSTRELALVLAERGFAMSETSTSTVEGSPTPPPKPVKTSNSGRVGGRR